MGGAGLESLLALFPVVALVNRLRELLDAPVQVTRLSTTRSRALSWRLTPLPSAAPRPLCPYLIPRLRPPSSTNLTPQSPRGTGTARSACSCRRPHSLRTPAHACTLAKRSVVMDLVAMPRDELSMQMTGMRASPKSESCSSRVSVKLRKGMLPLRIC